MAAICLIIRLTETSSRSNTAIRRFETLSKIVTRLNYIKDMLQSLGAKYLAIYH